MTAIILGWNPDRWNDWNYADVVERVAATGLHLERWSVGRHRNIAAGTDAWLLRQGVTAAGLIGHGVVVSEQPEPGPHLAEPAKTAMYVQVAFDSLLPLGDQIASAILRESVPGVPWGSVFGSGLAVEPSEEANIRALWGDLRLRRRQIPQKPRPGRIQSAQ